MNGTTVAIVFTTIFRPNEVRRVAELLCIDIITQQMFSSNPLWGAAVFRRRFRMSKHRFIRIADALEANDEYFQLRQDATGSNGFTTFQKCMVALRPTGKCIFGNEYLRKPLIASGCFECIKTDMASPECSGASTVCIGHGKIV